MSDENSAKVELKKSHKEIQDQTEEYKELTCPKKPLVEHKMKQISKRNPSSKFLFKSKKIKL